MTMAVDPASFEVHAAGAVVWRKAATGIEVAVVHRPRYDDWSFAKGKLDPGESFEVAAVRELAEETGLDVVLGAELPASTYIDHRGRSKLVRWWLAEVAGGRFVANDEVDELRWCSPDEAAGLLTYGLDRQLLGAVMAIVAGP